MNEKQKETYEIILLGQNISVKTSLGHEEIRQLVVLIEDQVSELKKQNKNLPPQKLHLLALMGMTEKYIELRSNIEKFKNELKNEVGNLKQYVERFIQNSDSSNQNPIPGTDNNPL